MTPKYETLYEDGTWKLMKGNSIARNLDEDYWLNHDCDSSRLVKRYLYMIDIPCSLCGSVCPDGLQGMYLTLAVL